jgi:hypothetical protein
MVTTTTTLPASRPIDDACSVELVEPKMAEVVIGIRKVLPATQFVKLVPAYMVRPCM